jgi:hypothetical protein
MMRERWTALHGCFGWNCREQPEKRKGEDHEYHYIDITGPSDHYDVD